MPPNKTWLEALKRVFKVGVENTPKEELKYVFERAPIDPEKCFIMETLKIL
jgi:hypothetical protein